MHVVAFTPRFEQRHLEWRIVRKFDICLMDHHMRVHPHYYYHHFGNPCLVFYPNHHCWVDHGLCVFLWCNQSLSCSLPLPTDFPFIIILTMLQLAILIILVFVPSVAQGGKLSLGFNTSLQATGEICLGCKNTNRIISWGLFQLLGWVFLNEYGWYVWNFLLKWWESGVKMSSLMMRLWWSCFPLSATLVDILAMRW